MYTSVLRTTILFLAMSAATFATDFTNTIVPDWHKQERLVGSTIDSDTVETGYGTWNGIEFRKSLAHYEEHLPEFEAYIYTRALNQQVTYSEFMDYIKSITQKLTKLSTSAPVPQNNDRRRLVRTRGTIFSLKDHTVYLEYSINNATPEFAILHIYPANKLAEVKKLATTPITNTKAKFVIADHIEKDGSSVYIKDVPMVIQTGGYCVVATAARVSQYYGGAADQNELAQIAKSDPSKGTSNYMPIIKAASNKLRFRVTSEYSVKIPTEDHAAMRTGFNKLKIKPDFTIGKPTYYDMTAKQIQALVEGRKMDKSGMKRFMRAIQTSIDKANPLIWQVNLSFRDEADTRQFQAGGGHLRLIIGYDEPNALVYYSDSWGIGHEKKAMPLAEAYAMTRGWASVSPL